MFDIFIHREIDTVLLQGSYNPWLVGTSILVAIASSFIGLQIAGMAKDARGHMLKQVARVSGSLALGGGIWSMHFIGMLAFQMGGHTHYDLFLTVISMAPSVFASWISLHMLSSERINRRQLIIGGVLVGLGIGTMHYSGMAAMQTHAILRYDPWWFAASILVAVGLAILSLWIRFGLTERTRLSLLTINGLAGVVMGLAIAGMHYTGMAAARFIGVETTQPLPPDSNHVVLAVIISVITVIISMLVLAGNLILRYRQLYGQLREGESRLRAIVETAADGIITIDAQGAILAHNNAAEAMFGWQLGNLKFKHISTLMPEAFAAGAHADTFQQTMMSLTTAEREAFAVRRDGSVFPVRIALGKAEIPGQTLFIAFVTDISERVAMERELSSRELQYRTLISNIPGVAFRCQASAPWAVIFISDAIEKLTGWEAQKFFAHDIHLGDLVHPDDSFIARELHEALTEKRAYTLEYRLLHRDGSDRWVSESASGVYDETGKLVWIDGVLIDITESKRRAAEFEGVVKAIRRALVVVEFDMNGELLDANENFLTLTGYSLSDVVGKHHRELYLSQEGESENAHHFWDGLSTGYFQSGEFCLLGREDKPVWVQATYNPIYDADGKPWKVFQIALDLTDRKAMETDLVFSRDRAEQASIAKGMFLANMSHEIRTPMNAIIGFTELLIDSPLQPAQLQQLKTVRQSARSLLGLLNDILDTAKLERGALELDTAVFSLRELCQQIISELRVEADKKHLLLTLDYPLTARDVVMGDMLRVRQVLINLLGNAIKFTEAGEVTLRVEDNGGLLILQVIDTGIGIPADRIDHIFTPFTQADASMARRFGGTGLGTTIARQLTELMGGSISVTSESGRGSCFEVRLPLPPACAIGTPTAVTKPELPPLNMLIVDDVPQNIELLELMLARDGHRVTSANSGLQAWNLYQEKTFDLIVMDIQMPDVDGLQMTRIIRTWEKLHQRTPTPIIALTASVLEQDRQDARLAGMDGFASKPIDIIELYHEIARCLNFTHGASPQLPLFETVEASATTIDATTADLIIDWDNALRRWGDRTTLINAVERFCQEYQQQGALAQRQQPHQEAHRLKGAAANLGLIAVTEAAQAIEQSAEITPELSARLDTAFAEVMQQLSPPLHPQSNSASESIQTVERSVLLALQDAYSHGTFDEENYDQLKQSLPVELIKPLDEALDQFDFDTALELVKEWLATALWVTATDDE